MRVRKKTLKLSKNYHDENHDKAHGKRLNKSLNKTQNKNPDDFHEEFDWRSIKGLVIGVDEVGRGCLAGPVVAGACLLQSDLHIKEFIDSKLLSEVRRENIAKKIIRHHRVSTAFADLEEIATLNILWASMLAMKRAVEQVCNTFDIERATILVDGNTRIPDLSRRFKQILLIQGDRRAKPISAASIVAKVERDTFMKELHKEFPQYGFNSNKGYGSATHRRAIKKFGPSPWHRKDFSCVREEWHRLGQEIVGLAKTEISI